MKKTNKKQLGMNFLVVFCCSKLKLVIELDGEQHYNKDDSSIVRGTFEEE
ncbi:MAG: hypothetical protein B6227_04090 [Fusobacteriia bacterium 4572_74]|nr:MAG: hypothetical protein B6227_04090 [Fusobacteriia bacterium 4572_74]